MLAKRRLLFPIFLLVLVSFVVCIALSTRAKNEDVSRDSHEVRGRRAWDCEEQRQQAEMPAYQMLILISPRDWPRGSGSIQF